MTTSTRARGQLCDPRNVVEGHQVIPVAYTRLYAVGWRSLRFWALIKGEDAAW